MSADLGLELIRGKYHAIIPEMDPCKKCGGPAVATFGVGKSGYSSGSGHRHKPECTELRCPHGTLWSEPCEPCDNAEELNCHGMPEDDE